MLSRSESEWLARERRETLLATGASGAVDGGVPWLVCRGHPELITYCSGGPPEQGAAGPGGSTRRGRSPPRSPRGPPPGTHWAMTIPAPGWPDGHGNALRPARAGRAGSQLSGRYRAGRSHPGSHRAGLAVAGCRHGMGHRPAGRGGNRPAGQAGLVNAQRPAGSCCTPRWCRLAARWIPELYRNAVRAMYVIWDHYYRQAQEAAGPASQRVLAQCTAAEVPYLMRLGEWKQASRACERAINHDGSPARRRAACCPTTSRSSGRPRGPTCIPAHCSCTRIWCAPWTRGRGQAALTRLLEQAEHDKDDTMVMVAASALATVLAGRDPARAYELLQRAKAARAATEHQAWPWSLRQPKRHVTEHLAAAVPPSAAGHGLSSREWSPGPGAKGVSQATRRCLPPTGDRQPPGRPGPPRGTG